MKRSSLVVSVLGLAAVITACAPDIPQVTNKPLVVMEFDPAAAPPVVPSPNDLAIDQNTGLVTVPPNPTDTPTQIEFNRTYLNTLDGFPMESTASVATSGDLAPGTLATGVLVLDITNPLAPFPVTNAVPGYVAGSKVLTIAPPNGAWTRGHRYAIVIKGGNQTGALTGSSGQSVAGTAVWALVAGTVPLCALPDGGPGLPGSGCLPTTDLLPSAEAAAQLQELQLAYKPLIDALGVLPAPIGPIPRANIAILWTFKITSSAEVTFDPANNVIPFPNDAVRTGANGTVNLPVPPGTPPILAALIGGLNTLDGFSTTATITTAVDFNLTTSPGASALMQGKVDPATVTFPLAIGFVDVGGSGPSQGAPQVAVCVSDVPPGCPSVSATLLDGGVKPEVLGIVPLTPLSERTTYAVYLTNAIRDTTGKPVIPTATMARVRLAQPLSINDSSCPAPAAPCKSQVSLLTDAQAALLVQLQEGLAPFFAQLTSNGIPRSNVVLAWAFKTQSTVSALQQLASAPYNPAAGLPSVPLWAEDVTAVVRPQLTAAGVPTANIATIWAGEFIDLFALTSPVGTFNPGLAGAVGKPIPFIMTVPNSAAPAGGYPVTMFGHGLTGNKTHAYAIANALATGGQVMVAIDEVWHGERNTCTGFGAYASAATGTTVPDNGICLNPVTQSCNAVGRCQLTDRTAPAACVYGSPTADQTCFNLGQNECAPDNKCEGTGAGFNAAYSGWNLLNLSNLFATRDNFRQQVIDNSQFARVVSSTSTGNLESVTGIDLNPAKINYSGQSLGGILGTLYTSVAFNVQNAGLDVPGGNPVNILLTSPAFAAQKAGFLAGLAQAGIIQDSPVYDIFIDVARWILDPADPTNAAFFTIHKTGIASVAGGDSIPATRRTFVQWIVDDQVVPNPTTAQLIHAALHDPTADGLKVAGTGPFFGYQFNGSSTPFSFNTTTIQACTRHGFLLAPPPSNACSGAPGAAGLALTTDAQTQIVGFLAGVAPY